MKNIFTKCIFILLLFLCAGQISKAQVTMSPVADTLCIGSPVTLTFTGYFEVDPLYDWYFELGNDDVNYIVGDIPGNEAFHTTVPNVPPGVYDYFAYIQYVGSPAGEWDGGTGSFYVAPAAVATISGPTTGCDSVSLGVTGGTTYAWNGGENPTSATNTFTASGTYTVTVSTNGTCQATASVEVTVTNTVVASDSITASQTSFCAGTDVTFMAIPTNGGTSPFYQWQVNGYNVPCFSDTFSSSALNNNDAVSCLMTSSLACFTPLPASSNTLGMSVDGEVPRGTLGVAPGSVVCAGTPVTLTITPDSDVNTPTYQWMVNDSAVGAGNNTFTYTPNNGDSAWVVITSDVGCATVSEPSYVIHFVVNQPPAISLTASNSACEGNTTLSLSGASSVGKIVWALSGNGIDSVVSTAVGTSTIAAGGNGAGAAANQLSTPRAVWQDASGNTYVSDQGNNRIQKFPPNSTSSTNGITVAGSNGDGSAPDQISSSDVFVDNNGDIYALGATWVQKFPAGGTSATNSTMVAGSDTSGSAANQLDGPSSVKLDGSGNIYVNDGSNYRVQKFPAGSLSGANAVTVAGGNGPGSAADQLSSDVVRMYVNQQGTVYVADAGNSRVSLWTPGDTSGVIIAGGNGSGSNANQFNNCTAVFTDGIGNIYVTDQGNNRVQKFPPGSTSSTSGYTVAGGNGSGPAANQLGSATASYVDGNGNVYVSDKGNNQVSKWAQQIVTTYTPADTGNYVAIATSYNGCSATSNSIDVLPVSAPSVSIIASATTICSGTKVNFTATPTYGGASPSYQWKKNGDDVGTNSASYSDSTINDDNVISCVLTSNYPCASTGSATSNSITITVNQSPIPGITGSPTGCGLVTLTATGNGTYTWSGGNSPNTATDTFSISGAYTVTVTAGDNCTATVSKVVTVDSLPTALITPGGPTTFCVGDSVILTASAANGYLWSNSDTSQSITVKQGGNYTVIVSNGNDCSATSTETTVTVNSLPTATITAAGTTTFCEGDSVTLTSSTGISYLWSDSETTQSIAAKTGGSYTVIVSNGSDCSATSPATVVTVNPQVTPTISISTAQDTVCAQTDITFSANITNGGASPVYQWQVDGANVGTSSSRYSSSTLSNNAIVTCQVKSNAACATPDSVISNSITMTVIPLVTPSVSISASPTVVCAGSNITFTATPVNGGSSPSYQWYKDGNTVGGNTATYTDNSLITGDKISCVLTSNITCVTGATAYSDTITITISGNVVPAVTISTPSTNICSGGSVTFTPAPVNGGSSPTYQWEVNGSNVIDNAGAFTTSTLSNNDVVSCVMTSSLTCATPDTAASNTITVTVQSSVLPTISVTAAPIIACFGANVTFTASITNGGTAPVYQWMRNDTSVGANSASYSTNSLYSSDVITCLLTSNALCAVPDTVSSNSISVIINPLPNAAITPSGNVTICQGDSTALSAPAGNPGYLWSTSATTQSIFVIYEGNYEVTVTNINNCTAASAPDTVTVNPLPVPVITQVGTTLTSTTAVSYQWYLNGSLLNGDTSKQLLITEDGQYQVEVTDSNGCQNISAIFNASGAGISPVASVYDVKLYPDPNTGNFTLEFTDDVTREIEITDAVGRTIVTSTKVERQKNFNLNDLASGVYILRIIENDEVRSLKFSVLK